MRPASCTVISYPGTERWMDRTPVRMSPRGSTVAVLLLASVILAAGSRPPASLYAQGGTGISGSAISKVGRDTRKLTVNAQAGAVSRTGSGKNKCLINRPAAGTTTKGPGRREPGRPWGRVAGNRP